MKISEIKDQPLRELAELRRSESDWNRPNEDSLFSAFDWEETEDGDHFWSDVNDGEITSLNQPLTPKQWLDERGTLEVGSTMYNLVLTILEDYAKQN